ncbi:MAG: hypothetical protein LBH59_03255 [Planctomycetaceae bacterium]|jgi:hypothetical protein|nr:hypothetical protein [Planctomycetaceae bacterium]
MKTIAPPKNKHKTHNQKLNFKTITPPTPHVDLNVNPQSSPITRKSKVLRKRKSTKIAKTKSNSTTNNVSPKKKIKQLLNPINTDTTTKNISHHTYVNWPQQKKGKKRYLASPDSFENDTPFDNDELATLDEFESMTKNNTEIKPHFGKKPTITPRRQPQQRRRQIDPTTCERDYTFEEIEFMNALSEYKRSSGRMFPTCSEILEVLKNLGYEKTKENF